MVQLLADEALKLLTSTISQLKYVIFLAALNYECFIEVMYLTVLVLKENQSYKQYEFNGKNLLVHK